MADLDLTAAIEAVLHVMDWPDDREFSAHVEPDGRELTPPGCYWEFAEEIAQAVITAMTPPPTLSPQQVQILRLVAAGMTNQAIADRLHLGCSSVAEQLSRVYRKLGVSSRAAAVEVARQRGLLGGQP